MEDDSTIIDGEPVVPSAADEKIEKFFADVDEECMKRDPWADLAEFEQCLKDLDESFCQILESKDAQITEEKKLHCMSIFIKLTQLNRLVHFRNRILSKKLAEEIGSAKQNRQSLWDMDEQIRVVEYLTQNYLNFKLVFTDMGLEGDQFVAEKLAQLAEKELSPEEHEQFLKYLHAELKTRKKLASETSALESKKKSLGNKTASLKKSMQEIKPTLQAVLEATRPLMKLLGVSMEGGVDEQESLASLPAPLFYVYQQLIAYRDAFDSSVTVSLLTDELFSESQRTPAYDEDEMEISVETSKEPIDISPALEKPVQALATFPTRLEIGLTCEDKATALLSVYYHENVNVLSARCRLVFAGRPPSFRSLPTDVLGEPSILDDMFPGDGGDVFPDSIAGIKFSHNGISIGKAGPTAQDRWYLWLQRLGGLSHMTLSRGSQKPSSSVGKQSEPADANGNAEVLAFPNVVAEAIRSRVLARISLVEQIASIEKLQLDVPLEVVNLFPSRVHSQMVSWSSITLEQFMQHPASKTAEGLNLRDNGWRFLAKFKCDKAVLEALVYISSTYPVDAPVVLLCCRQDRRQFAEKNQLIESVERRVNVDCVEELPAHLANFCLVVQLKTVQVAFDMISQVGTDGTSEKSKLYTRGLRGRDREIPLVRLEEDKSHDRIAPAKSQ
uniref:THO complex subunit 5 homolog n=1 Tax=Trichuris muris TaxID=70415 RepID=A0A5S6QPC7_TRIMR